MQSVRETSKYSASARWKGLQSELTAGSMNESTRLPLSGASFYGVQDEEFGYLTLDLGGSLFCFTD